MSIEKGGQSPLLSTLLPSLPTYSILSIPLPCSCCLLLSSFSSLSLLPISYSYSCLLTLLPLYCLFVSSVNFFFLVCFLSFCILWYYFYHSFPPSSPSFLTNSFPFSLCLFSLCYSFHYLSYQIVNLYISIPLHFIILSNSYLANNLLSSQYISFLLHLSILSTSICFHPRYIHLCHSLFPFPQSIPPFPPSPFLYPFTLTLSPLTFPSTYLPSFLPSFHSIIITYHPSFIHVPYNSFTDLQHPT